MSASFRRPLVVLPKTSMVKPADVNGGPARTRRRYTQGNTRSKTIELGTLSEVEEDIYHNKDGYEEPKEKTTPAADNNGTVRRPTNGTVRSIARHLSERQKAERARSAATAAALAAAHSDEVRPGVSHEDVLTSVKFRALPCIHVDHRAIRCLSERNELRARVSIFYLKKAVVEYGEHPGEDCGILCSTE
ncbi:hypothetical protein Y032_0006g2801 [Ancylostoma ceylanicum]|uniref:Uncharacterized protein n=1 Tax=Ancylostoma ceylanicum TaxID=53326 RepID=A0A016VQV3_9BILA|nr:hypothetical protein Y032_0006g2801 [Ancylostoma ceylanicum]